MKTAIHALLGLGLIAALPAEANAAVCARGPYHAGCAGSRGAVVTHRGYAAPVHRAPVYGPHCYWRAGVRVCR